MAFPSSDHYWQEARIFLEANAKKLDAILAPNQFLELFPGTYDYSISHLFQADHYAFVVIHKHMVDEIDRGVVADIIETFDAVFANQIFAIYSRSRIPEASISADETE